MTGGASGYVQTVTGRIDAADVRRVLHHEHLLSLTPGPWLCGGRSRDDEHLVTVAVSALRGLPELGFNTVVDLSPYGVVGRHANGDNVALLKEISERSEIYIVAGTAVYLESFSPEWTKDAALDELTERFVADATDGIGNTTVKAGIFGEQATSLDEITAHEEKCLRAAARAARTTGLALTTHTTHGTMALEQIAILREEGMDLDRVVIGHQDTHPDTDYVLEVASTGVNIAFDTIGKQAWDFFVTPPPASSPDGPYVKDAYYRSDMTRLLRLHALVAAGFADRVLLSQDLTGSEVYLNPTTHGQYGYSYLGAAFARADGSDDANQQAMTAAQLEKLLHANPVRLLTVGGHRS